MRPASAPGGLLILAAAVAALIGLPVASVLAHVFSGGTSGVWQHLASTVLAEYVGNTLYLCLGVGVGSVAVASPIEDLAAGFEAPPDAARPWVYWFWLNGNITDETVDSKFYTPDQQELVHAIYRGIIAPEWHERYDKQQDDDSGGFGLNNSLAIFGTPGDGKAGEAAAVEQGEGGVGGDEAEAALDLQRQAGLALLHLDDESLGFDGTHGSELLPQGRPADLVGSAAL